MESLIQMLDGSTLQILTKSIFLPIVREISEDTHTEDTALRNQATRLSNLIRKHIGFDTCDKLRTKIQTKLMIRRANRKKILKQKKVTDFIKALKTKKPKQQKSKQLLKKRKTS